MKRSASEQSLKYLGRATNPCGPCGFEASFKRQGEGENHTFKVVWATRLRRISLESPSSFFPRRMSHPES